MVQALNRGVENWKVAQSTYHREAKQPPEVEKELVQATSPSRGAVNRKLETDPDREVKRSPDAEKKPVGAKQPPEVEKKLGQATSPSRGSVNRKLETDPDRAAKRPPAAEKKPVEARSPNRGAENGKLVEERPREAQKQLIGATSPNHGADGNAKQRPEAEKKPLPDLDRVKRPIFAGFFFCLLGISDSSEASICWRQELHALLPRFSPPDSPSPPPSPAARRHFYLDMDSRNRRQKFFMYIRKLLFSDLDKTSVQHVLRQLHKLPWAECEQYLVKCSLKVHKVPQKTCFQDKDDRYFSRLVITILIEALQNESLTVFCYIFKDMFLTKVHCHLTSSLMFRIFCRATTEHDQIHEKITSHGGKIVEASYFDVCTHLVVDGYHIGMKFEGSKIVSRSWITDCCKMNKVIPVPEDCMKALCQKYHQLFVCPFDESCELFSFSKAAERCKKKTFFVITPGAHRDTHRSLLADDFMMLLVKKSYILLRRLHQAGLMLSGKFDADNFIIHEALGEVCVRFGLIDEDAVESISSEGETLDIDRFEEMVRITIFRESVPGPSLNLWLSMLHDKEVKDLLVDSVLLMDLAEQSEKFSSLYDAFVNSKSSVHDAVVIDLRQYDGWYDIIDSSDCNFFLQDTFDRTIQGKSGRQRYKNEVTDLLRLLRNSRHHDALPHSAEFALVIRHNFTNLLADLQKALFLARRRFP